ncbi:MAG TPA: AAA family ATPase [Candidatus Xenobia bacterium]|jgi:predicted ATPase
MLGSDRFGRPPFLQEVRLEWGRAGPDEYPWNLAAIQRLLRIPFDTAVTFFVGENGSGKSTLLEAIAAQCGFNLQGGGRNANFKTREEDVALADMLVLSWQPKVTSGFFLRAESFFDYATYLDEMQRERPETLEPYGGVSLHEQSHGESFFALFKHRLTGKKNFLIFDEPEAALSPARQLEFLGMLYRMERELQCQVLIATHSPILLGYPGATIWSLDGSPMRRVRWEETRHYKVTKRFLSDRDKVFAELLEEDSS